MESILHYSYLNNVSKFLSTATVSSLYPEKTKVPFKEDDLWK